MHAHRSDVVIPVHEMPLALPGINELRLWDIDLRGISRVEVAAPANGSRPLVLLAPEEGTDARRLNRILGQLPQEVSVASFDPWVETSCSCAAGRGSRNRLPATNTG